MSLNPKDCLTGWDIGGAHLKVARCDYRGQLLHVLELPCPLWQGLDALRKALREAMAQLGNSEDHHYLTMTGELADIFPDRPTGVAQIINTLQEYIAADRMMVFSTEGWLSGEQAIANWQQVASVNWLATARFAGLTHPDALVIDTGTTTTDVIPVQNGQPCPTGMTDLTRQQSGELCYSGIVRTPVNMLCQSVWFRGSKVSLAREVFALTADCWRVLGLIEESAIVDDSADKTSWELAACQQRLARLLGTDASAGDDADWRIVAGQFAEKQIQLLTDSCLQVLSAHPTLDPKSPVIGAGVGRFIIAECARRLGRPYYDFAGLCDDNAAASQHAPATAVALLACQHLQ